MPRKKLPKGKKKKAVTVFVESDIIKANGGLAECQTKCLKALKAA